MIQQSGLATMSPKVAAVEEPFSTAFDRECVGVIGRVVNEKRSDSKRSNIKGVPRYVIRPGTGTGQLPGQEGCCGREYPPSRRSHANRKIA